MAEVKHSRPYTMRKLGQSSNPRPRHTFCESNGRGQTHEWIQCVEVMVEVNSRPYPACEAHNRGQTSDLTHCVKLMEEIKIPPPYTAWEGDGRGQIPRPYTACENDGRGQTPRSYTMRETDAKRSNPRPYTACENDGRGQTLDLIHCVKLRLRGQTLYSM